MDIQATGYEKDANGHPDHVTAHYTMIQSVGEGVDAERLDKAMDHMCNEAGQVWLATNSILFWHTLEYQNELSDFLTESKDAIEALHDHIWTVFMKVIEDTSKPMADGLEIAICLVDMLPTFPIHLAFHSSTLGFTRFMPEIYTAQPKFRTDALHFSHMPLPGSDWKALDVLHEKILKNMCGTPDVANALEPMCCFAMVDPSPIGVKAC